MRHYSNNAKWLIYLTPFQSLPISMAYITPFFIQHGLSLSQILLLQSIFSIAVLLWEVPSGYLADKLGRALCIKISSPIAAISMVTYSISSHFWQFAVCEITLAIASGLISGISEALLFDSLKADSKEHKFTIMSQQVRSASFISYVIGAPVSAAIVYLAGINATLMTDGLLIFASMAFAFRLVEAPMTKEDTKQTEISAIKSIKRLCRNSEVCWLVLLITTLSTATYVGFWLSAPYYLSIGLPEVSFSVIFALRNLFKAFLSRKITQDKGLQRNMAAYASLSVITFGAMSAGNIWLLLLILGHDIVHALSSQPIIFKLNSYFEPNQRATMNSLVSFIQRLVYAVVGPLVGLLIDKTNLSAGFIAMGIICGILASISLLRLYKLKTFA